MQHAPLEIWLAAISRCCAPCERKSYRKGRKSEESAYQSHTLTLEQFRDRWRNEILAHPEKDLIIKAMTARKMELREMIWTK